MAAARRAQTGTDGLYRLSVPRLSGIRAAHAGLTAQTQARSAQNTTLRMAKMLSTTRRKVMAVKRYDPHETCGVTWARREAMTARADTAIRTRFAGWPKPALQ